MTIIVLTGAPGIGKTTAVMRAATELNARGLKVGGIVSRDLRIDDVRIGFKFIDLITNDANVLASVTGNGPKVGKYFVNLEGCSFAAERLHTAIKSCDVIICDEVGPMELKSREFIDSAKSLLDVDKKVIVVVHQKLQHPLTEQFRKESNLLISLDLGNRDKINERLVNRLLL